MTPTNQDIVDAAKKAGIDVYVSAFYDGMIVTSKNNEGYPVYLNDDNFPGSALFIVAVLGVLPKPVLIDKGPLFQTVRVSWAGPYATTYQGTLTEACAHALVAAFPATTTTSGGEN